MLELCLPRGPKEELATEAEGSHGVDHVGLLFVLLPLDHVVNPKEMPSPVACLVI